MSDNCRGSIFNTIPDQQPIQYVKSSLLLRFKLWGHCQSNNHHWHEENSPEAADYAQKSS